MVKGEKPEYPDIVQPMAQLLEKAGFDREIAELAPALVAYAVSSFEDNENATDICLKVAAILDAFRATSIKAHVVAAEATKAMSEKIATSAGE